MDYHPAVLESYEGSVPFYSRRAAKAMSVALAGRPIEWMREEFGWQAIAVSGDDVVLYSSVNPAAQRFRFLREVYLLPLKSLQALTVKESGRGPSRVVRVGVWFPLIATRLVFDGQHADELVSILKLKTGAAVMSEREAGEFVLQEFGDDA